VNTNDRLQWIRRACDWSDFDEPTEIYGNDTQMVFIENDVRCHRVESVVRSASALYIGRYSSLSDVSLISPMVTIGRHCSIAVNVLLGGGAHHMDHLSTGIMPGHQIERDYFADAEDALAADDIGGFTRIGCDVWIGANASILRGRTVGTGACIGAGTVVTHDVPPYAVVVGNPGRVVRYRFPEPIVESLLRTRWWTLPAETIATLPVTDIEACVELLEDIREQSA